MKIFHVDSTGIKIVHLVTLCFNNQYQNNNIIRVIIFYLFYIKLIVNNECWWSS